MLHMHGTEVLDESMLLYQRMHCTHVSDNLQHAMCAQHSLTCAKVRPIVPVPQQMSEAARGKDPSDVELQVAQLVCGMQGSPLTIESARGSDSTPLSSLLVQYLGGRGVH